jgi:hypothetical protein
VHFLFQPNELLEPLFTCLEHFVKAEGGTLLGAICSRILPVALNSGKTSIKTATDTIPRHRTSAFSILRIYYIGAKGLNGWPQDDKWEA